MRVHTGEAGEWEHRLFHRHAPRIGLGQVEFCQAHARHYLGRNSGNRGTNGFCNEWYGPTGAGIGFQHIDFVILDGELNIDQAAYFQCAGKGNRLLGEAPLKCRRKRIGRQGTGRIARMHTRFFDMFHDAGDVHILAIAQRVHIHFNRIGQISVNE